jgi:hypothetical protein
MARSYKGISGRAAGSNERTEMESMKRHAMLTALLMMSAAIAHAGPTAKILDFGIFSADPLPADQAKTGPLGRYALVERTRKVPLQVGVRFGFCAEITGIEGFEGKATFTEIVRHPVMTLPNGTEAAGWNVPRMVKVEGDRAVWCGGHLFREPHELVPGKWRFTVGDGDGDFIVEEFEAVPATAR